MQTSGGTPLAAREVRHLSRGRATLVAAGVIALDQVTKFLIVSAIPEGASRPVIGDLLRLSHIRNPGAAFGLLRGLGGFLVLAAAVGVVAFAAVVVRRPPLLTGIAAALVAGGASGNLLDRIFRSGGVVDFVDLSFWYAFNVADAAISVGAVLLLVASFIEGREDRVRAEPQPAPD